MTDDDMKAMNAARRKSDFDFMGDSTFRINVEALAAASA
jgi:hypothetical protein